MNEVFDALRELISEAVPEITPDRVLRLAQTRELAPETPAAVIAMELGDSPDGWGLSGKVQRLKVRIVLVEDLVASSSGPPQVEQLHHRCEAIRDAIAGVNHAAFLVVEPPRIQSADVSDAQRTYTQSHRLRLAAELIYEPGLLVCG